MDSNSLERGNRWRCPGEVMVPRAGLEPRIDGEIPLQTPYFLVVCPPLEVKSRGVILKLGYEEGR